jgi:pimeloyl-ACP methyl ester carboxylesterase
MNVTHPCEQTCTLSCSAPCGLHAPGERFSLAGVLDRFAREATQRVCDTGHYRCRYFTWGEGPPLLFVPGLLDSSRSFVLPAALLSRSFRCIGYDLPSGCEDGANLRRLTHTDLVHDLSAVLDHAGARQSYLFGSGFGTTVALAALRAAPERLPRAVLNAPVVHKPLSRTERLIAWLLRRWPGSLASLPLWRRLMQRLHHPSFAALPPEWWEDFLGSTGTLPARALGHRARLLHRLDLRDQLAEVRQPVLLVCGDRDPLVRREEVEALLRVMPSAGLVILEGCGHLPMRTHPELLAEVVHFFLTPPNGSEAPARKDRLALDQVSKERPRS